MNTQTLPLITFVAAILIYAIPISMTGQKVYLQQSSGHVYQYLYNGYFILETVIVDESGIPIETSDIAITPNGRLFAVSSKGELMQVHWESGLATILSPRNTILSQSLVCSGEDQFIFLDTYGDVIEINARTLDKKYVGSTGLSTPGDLTLHKGNVIFPTHEKLMAYNIERDSLYTLHCFDRRRKDYGITRISSRCSNDIFILPANKWDDERYIFTFNAESKEVLSMPQHGFLRGNTYGMASEEEHLGLQCPSEIVYPLDCLATDTQTHREDNLMIYPNPTDQYIHIMGALGLIEIEVRSITGHLLEHISTDERQIDLGHLPDGIYILEISNSGKSKTERLIIK